MPAKLGEFTIVTFILWTYSGSSPAQWVRALFAGVQRPGRRADHHTLPLGPG